MPLSNNTNIDILNVKVGTQSLSEMIDFISNSIIQRERVIIQYINVHAVNLAQVIPWVKSFLNNASMTYCDGIGVRLAAFILGTVLPNRYTIPDWFPKLATHCKENGYSFYLLGGKPGVAEIAAERLRQKNPGLAILGTHHGFFDKTIQNFENQTVIEIINALDPDILAVGFGMPVQEKWLDENWDDLKCRVAIPMGAAIDYLAGTTRRAPKWMTDNGLEWLGRLFIEPRRLWRRYLLGIPTFYLRVFQQRFGYYRSD